jgi:hypothetical protein
MGAVPEYVPLIRAAKYLGVAPWELAERPAAWRDWALAMEHGEASAQRQLQQRAQRQPMRR